MSATNIVTKEDILTFTQASPGEGLNKGKTEEREEMIGKIAYNDRSNYYRNLLNAGFNVEYQAKNFILSAVTGYQHLKDRMFDQTLLKRTYSILPRSRN